MPFTIQPARPEHAAGIIALLQSVASDPVNNILREPGEPMFTEEDEREFLTRQAERFDWCGFVAASENGEVIGMVTIDGQRRRAIRHCGDLGISVRAGWRGQGVGKTLMERAIVWARESGVITRVELGVLSRNSTAIRLYERLGFHHEGLRKRAVLRNGEYLDMLMMALLL
ncbi:MAG TPA: GNAT family protein [Ktedonobacterales bacterium]